MAETKKMTLKDYYNEVITLAKENGREDLVTFCNERIEVLSRKNVSKGLTSIQKENVEIKDNILAIVTDEKQSATALTKAYNEKYGTEYSTNKITALLTQLKGNNVIVRTEEKGKAYFSRG